jgi:hypothetical protein
MSDNVENAVFDILKKIQGDLSAIRADLVEFRRDNSAEHERMDAHIGGVETIVRKQQRDGAGMLVMTRAVAGDFEERVTDLEQRVTKLEHSDH